MIRPNDDTNQTDLIAGYVLEDLSLDEADCLNQILAEVPALSGEIESFQEAFSLLPYDMPLLEPSALLKEKIISAASHSLADTSLEPIQSNVVPLASPRRRSWQGGFIQGNEKHDVVDSPKLSGLVEQCAIPAFLLT